jgi:hypothetical protein
MLIDKILNNVPAIPAKSSPDHSFFFFLRPVVFNNISTYFNASIFLHQEQLV